jgi:hypothetical protein
MFLSIAPAAGIRLLKWTVKMAMTVVFQTKQKTEHESHGRERSYEFMNTRIPKRIDVLLGTRLR